MNIGGTLGHLRLVELAGRLDYAASSSHHLGSQRFGWEPQQKKEGASDSMVPNCKVQVVACLPKN